MSSGFLSNAQLSTILCEKARALYRDLLEHNSETTTEEVSTDAFKASCGWFDDFKKRTGIYNVVRYGEVAISDTKEAENFVY